MPGQRGYFGRQNVYIHRYGPTKRDALWTWTFEWLVGQNLFLLFCLLGFKSLVAWRPPNAGRLKSAWAFNLDSPPRINKPFLSLIAPKYRVDWPDSFATFSAAIRRCSAIFLAELGRHFAGYNTGQTTVQLHKANDSFLLVNDFITTVVF